MSLTGSKLRRLRAIGAGAALIAVIATALWMHYGARVDEEPSATVAGATPSGAHTGPPEQSAGARAAIAAKASAQIGRSVATAPLPPPGAPLAQTYDELKARADAGDAEAAMQLFHEVHRCIEVRQTRRWLAVLPSADVTPDHPDDRSIGVVRPGQAPEIKVVREMTDYIQANGARCEGATDAQLATFTPLLLHAAQLGNLKALDCYVGTDFDMMEGLLDHPEWIDQYRTQVPGLVDAALKRGDWVIVDLLHHAYSGAFDTSARGQLFGIDPAMDYGLLLLEQLGATGAFADKLAPMVAGAAKALSPAQAAAAEDWANDYYSRYFNSVSNEVSNGANFCQISDD